MAINKVMLGSNTLIDLTADTVTADNLANGYTAHDRSGTPIVGTMSGGGGALDDLSDVTIDITTLADGDALVYDGTDSLWENRPLETVAFSGNYNDLSNTPTIPTQLSDLSEDTNHQSVTAQQKTDWNAKSTVTYTQTYLTPGQKIGEIKIDGTTYDVTAPSGGGGGGGGAVDSVNGQTGTVVLDLDDINDTSISGQTDNDVLMYESGQWINIQLPLVALTGSYGDLQNKPTIPAAQVNSDWNASGTIAEILNKPSIPSISIAHTGTADVSNVRREQITLNSVNYDVDGSVYMEDSGNKATFAFNNALITTTSAIDVYTNTWGDNPTSVTVTTGTCTVTFSAAASRSVRIYIK